MKQRITVEQLKELTGLQQERLRELYTPEAGDWFYRSIEDESKFYGSVKYHDDSGVEVFEPEKIDLPLLSIGQMIELIDQNRNDQMWSVMAEIESCRTHDLCNELWESVKIILE